MKKLLIFALFMLPLTASAEEAVSDGTVRKVIVR
jgi:hypothetical protein